MLIIHFIIIVLWSWCHINTICSMAPNTLTLCSHTSTWDAMADVWHRQYVMCMYSCDVCVVCMCRGWLWVVGHMEVWCTHRHTQTRTSWLNTFTAYRWMLMTMGRLLCTLQLSYAIAKHTNIFLNKILLWGHLYLAYNAIAPAFSVHVLSLSH